MKWIKGLGVLGIIFLLGACTEKKNVEIINDDAQKIVIEEQLDNLEEIEDTMLSDLDIQEEKDIIYVDEIYPKKSFSNSLYNTENVLGVVNENKPILSIDLNNDGIKENVEYSLKEKAIKVNDTKYVFEYLESSEFEFIDLNSKDKSVEFIRVDNSLSDAGGFCYDVFTFDGEKIIKLFDVRSYGFAWNSDKGIIAANPEILNYLTADVINEQVAVWYKIENQIINKCVSNKILNTTEFTCRQAAGPWNNICIDVTSGKKIEFENKKFEIKNVINGEKILIEFEDGKSAYLWNVDQR